MKNYKTIRYLEPESKWTDIHKIVEKECESCEYDRATLSYSDYASAGVIICNNPNCKSKEYI